MRKLQIHPHNLRNSGFMYEVVVIAVMVVELVVVVVVVVVVEVVLVEVTELKSPKTKHKAI